MVTALDVAEFILQEKGEMTAMKLQKLVYYAQVWSLVWDEKPLFEEKIEAWVGGPVVPSLYERHKGQFTVTTLGGNPNTLDDNEKDTVRHVLEFYGDRSAHWLSDLTHIEKPWIAARQGLPPGVRGNAEISLASMAEYYSEL